MTFAYADPPYMGLAHRYGDPEIDHEALIGHLCDDFPDGWALSLHSPSLKRVLALCPDDVRILSWVKPWASFKPGVTVAYAWEPVIIRGGRKRPKERLTVRDWIACSCTLKRDFIGAKPEAFCFWLFEVLGMAPDDTFCDLFPGSGAVSRAWTLWQNHQKSNLFAVEADSLSLPALLAESEA